MKGVTSFNAVMMMKNGSTPMEACAKAVRYTHDKIKSNGKKPRNIAIVCMNNHGEFAGAANHKGFSYAAFNHNKDLEIFKVDSCI